MVKIEPHLPTCPIVTIDHSHQSNVMTDQLIFDFADLPKNSVQRQTVAVEQLCILCGLGRRPSRRISKGVFSILSNHSLEDFVENSILLSHIVGVWNLIFRFETRALSTDSVSGQDRAIKSVRRLGEKLDGFEINGTPVDGLELSFRQSLGLDFVPPKTRELKKWRQVFIDGDWEEGFGRVSRLYLSGRAKNQQLRDGISIRKAVLESKNGAADVILSLIASKTDNAVMIFDSVANLEWINQAFANFTGTSLPEKKLVNVNSVLFEGADSDALRFQEQLSTGTSFDFMYSISGNGDLASQKETDETNIWFEFQLTPVRDENDEIVRWIGIGANVTHRRHAELALQAAKEVAESASRAKSEFLAMMSHEIRTPMNAILGMTELTLGTQLSMDQREYLTTANNAAQSLLQVLNDVLDLSKVEARRLELEHVDFNLADLVRETCDTLAVLAEKKGLKLHCEFPWEIPQDLVGDMSRIRQILVNLVGNAIKFTSVGQVELNLKLTDEINDRATIQFSVRDTGVGISEEKISRIFEAFYQTDASVNRQYGGTGLGLSITAELVRLMGGRIWAESKPENGSTFHFVLTFNKSPQSILGIDGTAMSKLRGKHVLLISDNHSVDEKLTKWLGGWGLTVRCAKVRETLNIDQFDVVMVDVDSLDQDAYQFAKTLLANNGPPQILIFSAGQRLAAINQLRKLGIEDYLINPVSPRYLATVLQSALGRPMVELKTDEIQRVDASVNFAKNPQTIETTNEPVKVLIVDDHTANRKLICEVLRKRGHQWHEVNGGDAALDLLRQEEFDVVLMDVEMPDKDGLQTTSEIRLLSGNVAAVPVVAVTAYVTDVDRQRCLDASMDDYLSKPINVAELLEKVERWGRTDRTVQDATDESETMDDQLLIQDAPDWATQLTQAIVNAETAIEDSEASCFDDDLGNESEQFAMALERFGGDEELLRMQMDFFMQGTPQLLNNINEAINHRDAKALHHNAHRLKGLINTFDAEFAGELAAQLEEMGQTDSFEKANATFALLESVVEELQHKISSY